MNSSNNFVDNLYIHLNNNQYYTTYNTSYHSQPYINSSIYDKLLHDFQNFSP